LGIDTKVLQFEDKLFTRFYRCAFDFYSFLPDLVLCINHSSRYVASFIQDIPIPRLVWFVDHPSRTVDIPFHPQDKIFTVADEFWDEIKRRKGKVIATVPVASSSNLLHPPANPKWRHDVSYVGSILDCRPVLDQLDTSCRQWVDEVVRQQMANPLEMMSKILKVIPPHRKYRKALAQILPSFFSKARYMKEEQLLEYFLYAEANTRRRIHYIKALEGFKSVGIYGPNAWKELLPDQMARNHRGYIANTKDLQDLYRHSKVNLSINSLQGFSFINQRFFEVPSAGGFLVGEYFPGLENIFEENREILWFHNVDEMISVADMAIKDEGFRIAALSRIQTNIQNEHTYKNRAEIMIEHIQNE
jgi:spore maturation protein CgeB